jgi:hypothetical protein
VFLLHAPPETARGIDVTSGLEQRFESDGRIGIAAPARTLQRRVGTGEIPTGREEDAEAERRSRMVGRVSEFIGTFRARQITAPFEQAAEVERAVRVAACARALVAGLSLLTISALFEEDPEIDRRGGVSQRICLPICALGGGQITAFLQPHPEAEPLLRGARALSRCVCAPRHSQSPREWSFLSYVTIQRSPVVKVYPQFERNR